MPRPSTFNFRLPSDLKERLDRFVENRGMSRADIAIAAIREFLDSIENESRALQFAKVFPVTEPSKESLEKPRKAPTGKRLSKPSSK